MPGASLTSGRSRSSPFRTAAWVDSPDALKYFAGHGGDQLDVIELTQPEAQARPAELGVDL